MANVKEWNTQATEKDKDFKLEVATIGIAEPENEKYFKDKTRASGSVGREKEDNTILSTELDQHITIKASSEPVVKREEEQK